MPSLHDLLAPDAVRVDVPADDWRAAIHAAGDLLVRSGVTGPSYTDAMIHVVEQHGPYIVIAPGFAFAHSRPDDSVTRTGMSAVRLTRPVVFGHDSNDPVTLVVALAAVDSNAHRQALAELARLLGTPERRAVLESARTADELRAAFAPAASATPATSGAGAAATAATASTTAAAATSASEASTAAPTGSAPAASSGSTASAPVTHTSAAAEVPADAVASKGFILTVCGNGLGTSLFLKNTLEGVLDRWGWGRHIRVEATDTISARGRAGEADALFTSGAIAQTLGDVGVPVEVIQDFTSASELDAAMRRVYAV